MNYAEIKNCDIANGEGVRVSLFVSGCRRRCKGCFNQVAWDFSYGKPFDQEIQNDLMKMLSPDYISGLTLLGGDPFEPENQRALYPFVQRVKEVFPKKNIWCFTGYTFEKGTLKEKEVQTEVTEKLLLLIDVLVDGRFEEDKKDIRLRFRGSSNQRIIDVKRSISTGSIVLCQT